MLASFVYKSPAQGLKMDLGRAAVQIVKRIDVWLFRCDCLGVGAGGREDVGIGMSGSANSF